MAKEIINYICEVCGQRYLIKKGAENCEHQHYKVVQITGVSYDVRDNKKEFPLTINVKLKNAENKEKIITYSRK